MIFKPKNFRRITNPPSVRIRDTGPLILVKTDGEAGFASTPENKDVILAKYEPEKGDLLLWAWPGKTRTDVFLLGKEEIQAYYQSRITTAAQNSDQDIP